jgi:heptosyltransferase-2
LAAERRGREPARIVRAPNHLGDVVLALPALVADGSDVLVLEWLAPLVRLAGVPGRILGFERGAAGWLAAVRELRRRAYREGVLLTPAFSAAWLFRWGAVRRLRGTDTDGRGMLLSERIRPEALRPHHRVDQYRLLLGQDVGRGAAVHFIAAPTETIARWRTRVAGTAPLVGLVPGANAPARRWPLERFCAVARTLAESGAMVVVMGGPAERSLTRAVSSAAPRALDVGGRTDLVDLAALLSLCEVVVTNDTGPMHLAGAVGTPTVTVWGPSDPREVGQRGALDVRVTGPELPCKPCHRNHCPRRGRGTRLDRAHEECMRLIEVPSVVEAVESLLALPGAR